MAALSPPLLQIVSERGYARRTTVRGGAFRELTGSEKASDGFPLQIQCPADLALGPALLMQFEDLVITVEAPLAKIGL